MKCLQNSLCARSYRLSLIHHLLDLDKSWNVKVFWDGKKMRRIEALNPNVRKIDMHIFVLSKLYQSKNSKSINSKPLLGSIFTIELEVLAQIFLFRFLKYSISEFSEALCILNLTPDLSTDKYVVSSSSHALWSFILFLFLNIIKNKLTYIPLHFESSFPTSRLHYNH